MKLLIFEKPSDFNYSFFFLNHKEISVNKTPIFRKKFFLFFGLNWKTTFKSFSFDQLSKDNNMISFSKFFFF